jgi:hypothetical protein
MAIIDEGKPELAEDDGPSVEDLLELLDHRLAKLQGELDEGLEDLDGRLTRLEELYRNWSALPDEDITTWRKRWTREIEERLARPKREVVERLEAAAKQAAESAVREAAGKLEERVNVAIHRLEVTQAGRGEEEASS